VDRLRAFYIRPWRIDVTRRSGVPLPTSMAALARTAAAALSEAGAPSPASLALILSEDSELLDLNTEHMGEDHATDVLSFPLLPPAAYPDHAGKADSQGTDTPREPDYRRPSQLRAHLGDIVISVERAIEQAPDQGWSAPDELRQLVVHGVLHVCGWDHAIEEERDAMRALERKVLSGS
jgi:probable rRNA maturation factor